MSLIDKRIYIYDDVSPKNELMRAIHIDIFYKASEKIKCEFLKPPRLRQQIFMDFYKKARSNETN